MIRFQSFNSRIILYLLLFSNLIYAKVPDSTMYTWIPSLVGGLYFSQIAFSNWTKGGQNSINWTLDVDFDLNYRSEYMGFRTKLNSTYGRTKLNGNIYRTNENEIFLDQVVSYHADWKVDPFISNSVQTQITTGFDYKGEEPKKVADFFDPAVITQSLGFTYDRESVIRTRLGVAFQHTITNEYRKYSDDPATPDEEESYKFETGIESVTYTKFNLDKNITAESHLILFTRFEEIEVWDIRWDNKMVAKVNSWLNVIFTFNFVFKKSESYIAQMKESWQMGISYHFI